MKKVIISVINDLVTDQRVNKVAQTLLDNDYSVLLLGRLLPESMPIKRAYKTKRMTLLFNKGILFYIEMNIRIFLFLLFHKFDIALSNDLDTLLPNYLVTTLKNKKLVYDSHEIFPEVPEIINRKFVKTFWEKLEKFLLHRIKFAYTVNTSVSEHYFNKYGIEMKIVRNVPYLSNKSSEIVNIDNFKAKRKIIIYQGALNIGRGLELIISAMQFVHNAELQIIGDGDIKNKLIKLSKNLNLSDRVKFIGKIPLDKLKKYTFQGDLGVSLEENLGLNYYFSLPNKIFDYINAEIPVIVSDLPEMSKLVQKYNIGIVIKSRKNKELAKIINNMFDNIQSYMEYKNNISKAKSELYWENEEKTIIDLFANICQ